MEERYNRFISSLELISITVPTISWNLFNETTTKEDKLITELGLSIDDPKRIKENQIELKANLNVEGNTPDKRKYLEINITVKLIINFNPDYFTEDIFMLYVNRNAIFSIMAIFREQVRYATFQMGLKPLILPALKIMPSKKNRKSGKTKAIKKETSVGRKKEKDESKSKS